VSQMRFKYSTTDASQNEFDSLPRLPLILRNNDQSIEIVGLVDSGATVNVLPYDIGVQLGDRSYCSFSTSRVCDRPFIRLFFQQ